MPSLSDCLAVCLSAETPPLGAPRDDGNGGAARSKHDSGEEQIAAEMYFVRFGHAPDYQYAALVLVTVPRAPPGCPHIYR